jgi:hypothetical protein
MGGFADHSAQVTKRFDHYKCSQKFQGIIYGHDETPEAGGTLFFLFSVGRRDLDICYNTHGKNMINA